MEDKLIDITNDVKMTVEMIDSLQFYILGYVNWNPSSYFAFLTFLVNGSCSCQSESLPDATSTELVPFKISKKKLQWIQYVALLYFHFWRAFYMILHNSALLVSLWIVVYASLLCW